VERLRRIALVAEDDVLNVRVDPDVAAPIVGMLPPGSVVVLTGEQAATGPSVWVGIETPRGAFWVNSWYLTPVVGADEFANDARVPQLLDALEAIIGDDGDLRRVTGRRGLYVAYNDEPIRFSRDDLASILTDDTTYRWASAGADAAEVPARTFADAIADSFLSAYHDVDTEMTRNEPITGGNGRIPAEAIPFELRSFNYVGVHDPGDDAAYGGLDWVTWYASVDYEDGAPVVVGLTIDSWSP
jgi:hypothetical protein